jgi:hypothetical protein
MLLCSAGTAHAQRLSSLGLAAGAVLQDDARATAAFTGSAGIHWIIPWTTVLQRSVADLEEDAGTGTLHDVSFAVLPSWEPWQGRILLSAGPSLHAVRHDYVNGPDESRARIAATGLAGLRLPVAGVGVNVELLARADVMEPATQFSALFGMRIRPGIANTLVLGEPRAPAQVAARRAIWNDVLMQLILLQQSLESFTRIKEVETGIELEFDQRPVTLYDDIARVARVLAAADPPVMVTVFAPNAGRVGAAVTAGSFPAERLRLQRDSRVYLRVEH